MGQRAGAAGKRWLRIIPSPLCDSVPQPIPTKEHCHEKRHHHHWSVPEMMPLTVAITSPNSLAPKLLAPNARLVSYQN